MGVKESLQEFADTPLAKATGVSAVVGLLVKAPLVLAALGTVWAQLGTIFTALSVTAFTIAPRVPEIPASLTTDAALLFGAAFVGKLVLVKVLYSGYKRFRSTKSGT